MLLGARYRVSKFRVAGVVFERLRAVSRSSLPLSEQSCHPQSPPTNASSPPPHSPFLMRLWETRRWPAAVAQTDKKSAGED